MRLSGLLQAATLNIACLAWSATTQPADTSYKPHPRGRR